MSDSKITRVVYFVRHGESEGNVDLAFQSPNCPLTDSGREQAQLVAERAAKIEFEALISSTFPRAQETAEMISSATGKEIDYSDLFVERMKPTSVDGKPYTDEVASATWRAWEKSLVTDGMRIEDGENYTDLVERADNALAYLIDRPERILLVVTHGYFLRVIMSRVVLGDLLTPELSRRFQAGFVTQNTGITVLRYHDAFEEESQWRTWIYNDHSHLG